MAANRNIILTLILSYLTSISVTQRTYMRHCDCEYMVDGKCAYTLLLPSGSGGSGKESTCPSSNELEQSNMANLEANLTKVTTWTMENSHLLLQLQSSMITIQNELLNGTTSPQIMDDMRAKLIGHDNALASLQSNFNQLYDAMNNLVKNLEHEHEKTHTTQTTLDQLALIHNDTLQKLANAQTDLQNLRYEVQELKMRPNMCAMRGLLVSGTSRNIPDDQLNASSQYNEAHSVMKLRITVTGREGAWCPAEPNQDYEWVQFDLGSPQMIYGIVTRGRADYSQWVTKYKVQYTDELGDDSWRVYKDVLGIDMLFDGNSDSNTLQTNMLWQPVRARYVRIWPLAGKGNICMRGDILGCVQL